MPDRAPDSLRLGSLNAMIVRVEAARAGQASPSQAGIEPAGGQEATAPVPKHGGNACTAAGGEGGCREPDIDADRFGLVGMSFTSSTIRQRENGPAPKEGRPKPP